MKLLVTCPENFARKKVSPLFLMAKFSLQNSPIRKNFSLLHQIFHGRPGLALPLPKAKVRSPRYRVMEWGG